MKLFSFLFVLGFFYAFPMEAQQILGSSELKVEKQFYFVEIKLNEKGPYNFWIDTGAGVTVIQPSLAEELGLKATGTSQIGTAGRPVTSTSYANIEVSLGDYSLGACTLEAFSIRHLQEYLGFPLHGIIGSDLLHQHIVELSMDKRQILFHPSSDFAQRSAWKAIDITYLPSGHFGVPVGIQLNKNQPVKQIMLKVDSGFNNYIVFTGQAVQKYDMLSQKKLKKVGGMSADTTITTNYSGKIHRISLAGKTWNRKRVVFPIDPISLASTKKAQDEGVFGNALLMDFNIIIDYAGKKMYFQPSSKK